MESPINKKDGGRRSLLSPVDVSDEQRAGM